MLEILIVIAIIGMLVGLLVKGLDRGQRDAKEAMASLFVSNTVKLPLTSYSMHMGSFPSTADGLNALIAPPSGKAERWRGPYFEDGKMPEDPWGQPYQYRYPGVKNKYTYDVWSKGPDQQDGTADDIGNW